jgi:hypothetical protein
MWEPRPLTPLWAFTACCYRDSFTFSFTILDSHRTFKIASPKLSHLKCSLEYRMTDEVKKLCNPDSCLKLLRFLRALIGMVASTNLGIINISAAWNRVRHYKLIVSRIVIKMFCPFTEPVDSNRLHRSPPLFSVLNQTNPIYIIAICISLSLSVIFLCFPANIFHLDFSTKVLYALSS